MNTLFSKKEQEEMLDGVLYWLNANISKFSTPDEATLCHIHPEMISPDITRKAFSELGLALRFALRSPAISEHPEFKKLKEGWLRILREKNFFFDTKRRVKLFPHRTLAYAALKSFGIENNEVKADLETVMNRQYMDRVERSAWEKLDMKYYTESAGLPNQFSSYEDLYQQCMLQNLPSMSYAQNYDFYGLTHLLFHFSDFSVKDMRVFFGNKYGEIQDYIDASLSLCLTEQNWDLVEELLINQYCMQKTFTQLDLSAASALKNMQQPDGFIPGSDWLKNFQEKPDFDKKSHSFDDVYHPTILGLFLLTCDLK
jgi:hypothetical protein